MTTAFERNTIISTKVMAILKDAHHAISLNQLMQKLRDDKLEPNRSTIYRIIQKLLDTEQLHSITIKTGTTYYELGKPKAGHHHHFVCTTCETLYCLQACHVEALNIDLSKLLPGPGFELESHDFNLYGRCATCGELSPPATHS